jgi:hypothetical protein
MKNERTGHGIIQQGIGLNCNPPKDEPGTKYELLKECGHIEAVELAIRSSSIIRTHR